jgi:hypothetical protein
LPRWGRKRDRAKESQEKVVIQTDGAAYAKASAIQGRAQSPAGHATTTNVEESQKLIQLELF